MFLPGVSAYFITKNLSLLIINLSISIALGISMVIFSIFIVKTVKITVKARDKYINDHRKTVFFVDRYYGTDSTRITEIRNLKNDYIFTVAFSAANQVQVLVKYENGKYEYVKHIRTVEIRNALYEAYEALNDLYEQDDHRPTITLSPILQQATSVDLII